MNRRYLVIAIALVLALAACSSDSGESTAGDTDSGSTTTAAPSGGSGDTTPPATGNAGSATLVVGDVTYEFDNYYCRQGSANTGNARSSFSSGSFGEVDGVSVQLDASIQDTNEGDAMEGDGTIQSITLNDIEDFENPSVSWAAETGFIGSTAWVIEYDGSTVHAEAFFDDGTTDDVIEEIPGTLDAVCGDG